MGNNSFDFKVCERGFPCKFEWRQKDNLYREKGLYLSEKRRYRDTMHENRQYRDTEKSSLQIYKFLNTPTFLQHGLEYAILIRVHTLLKCVSNF